ncbi:hypothetical protein CQW23_05933 [Capsicum baccatum]|uniref:C2H2-type domain-containing protein n=1 Tax=Capsicum baccatum TaxID=33114 RepID=A0A2G2XJ04_CAPBA|nr:hypothetical protein CQW23_05933 [Capsicum baccatum]
MLINTEITKMCCSIDMQFENDPSLSVVMGDFPFLNSFSLKTAGVDFHPKTNLLASEPVKSKKHKCPVCFKVFPLGQSLGGHKRAHYTGFTESKTKEPMVKKLDDLADNHKAFDLNTPGDDPLIRDGKRSISNELARFVKAINGVTIISSRVVNESEDEEEEEEDQQNTRLSDTEKSGVLRTRGGGLTRSHGGVKPKRKKSVTFAENGELIKNLNKRVEKLGKASKDCQVAEPEGNSLLAMYMNCGDKEGARRVFDAMQVRTDVIWNTTMISGYCRNDSPKAVLMIYRRMEDAGVDADCATVLSLLPACGCLKDVEMGREVHSSVEQVGIWDNLSVRNAVVDMYVKCGRMDEVRLVFEKMIDRDVMTWTTMIHRFISDGDIKNALWFSQKMQLEGVKPNAVTLASLLAACASLPHLRLGKCLHGWAIRQDLQAAVNVETGLIDMYAKCNCFRLGYQRSHRAFQVNLSEAVKPNNATPKSVLPAFSIEADLRQALSIHSYLLRSGFVTRTEVATGLVDIYSKCGNIDNGHKIFNEIPKKERDIISWSTLIAGYGMHGNGEISLSLFNEMIIIPVWLIFLIGLADLRNHMNLLKLTFEPSHAIWGALLGACVIHENVKLGELAARWLFKLEPENTGNSVLLGEIYSAVGRWKDAETVRCLMDEVGLVSITT